jgi:trans-2,3-dihydro-3-hydroxyanthranilate isomerase
MIILSLQADDIDPEFPIQSVSCGNNFLFVPLKNKRCMASVKLRMDKLEMNREILDSTELYVFTTDTVYPHSTTHGRMFAPFYGIAEDPATGSASGPLGCYLVHYGITDGRDIICEQGFEMGRPSMIHVSIDTEGGKISCVRVSGNAVKMSKGIFFV